MNNCSNYSDGSQRGAVKFVCFVVLIWKAIWNCSIDCWCNPSHRITCTILVNEHQKLNSSSFYRVVEEPALQEKPKFEVWCTTLTYLLDYQFAFLGLFLTFLNRCFNIRIISHKFLSCVLLQVIRRCEYSRCISIFFS